MNISFHSIVIFVQDIEVSKKFYCDILKQEITDDFGAVITLKNGLSLWQVPKGHKLEEEFYSSNKGNCSMEICFESEHFDEISHLIQSKKIQQLHNEIEEPWDKEP
jgi:catechol 2,3-dioxygenase-like lactoylglutathione lyase family enzyme